MDKKNGPKVGPDSDQEEDEEGEEEQAGSGNVLEDVRMSNFAFA